MSHYPFHPLSVQAWDAIIPAIADKHGAGGRVSIGRFHPLGTSVVTATVTTLGAFSWTEGCHSRGVEVLCIIESRKHT